MPALGMHAVVVFEGFQVSRDVALHIERAGHGVFDLRGDAMRLADRHRLGEQQVDFDPVGVTQGAMPQIVVGHAARAGLAVEQFGDLPVNLRVFVPAVENSVDAASYRPGDVLRSRKGLTVEVEPAGTVRVSVARAIFAPTRTRPCQEAVSNVASLAPYAEVSDGERALLESRERPVVLVSKRAGADELLRVVSPRLTLITSPINPP